MDETGVTPTVFTIGYEGSAQPDLIQTLLNHDIEVLVDIRELPQSRKPGLSKTALGQAAESHGIRYVHMRALGTPRDIRHQRKIDHDQEAFRRDFLAYLATQDEAMQELGGMIRQNRCCLLCYEADPHICHRWFVAERAREMNGGVFTIEHLAIATPSVP